MDEQRIRIEDCELDLAARLVTRQGRPLRLSPKAFALLAALVQAWPRALTKAELQERLWPGTFVIEANLANLVSELRHALDDDRGQPRFVRTVHGYGYAFLARPEGRVSTAPAAEGAHWLFLGRTRFALAEGDHILGRGPDSPVPLPDSRVSRRHARLSVRAGRAVLEDLESRNGTFVLGRRIDGAVALRNGDEIRIGPYYLASAVSSAAVGTTEASL